MTKTVKLKNKKSMKEQNSESFLESSTLSEEDTDSSDDFGNANEFDDEDQSLNIEKSKVKLLTTNKHLLELKETLGLETYKQQINTKAAKRRRQKERKRLKKDMEGIGNAHKNPDFVETLASKMGKADNIIPEIVEYNDPRKRPKKIVNDNLDAKENMKDSNVDEISMKEARFDVFKFGARGLDKKGQHDARVMLALSLGAKPEKSKCLPYDQYKEQKRVEKETDKKDTEMKKVAGLLKSSKRSHKSLKNQKGAKKPELFKNSISTGKDKGPKKSSGFKGKSGIQPKIGKFDGGMLRLSKKDIEKIKGNK